MTNLILLACVLVCPLSMGLMMWLMGRQRGPRNDSARESGE